MNASHVPRKAIVLAIRNGHIGRANFPDGDGIKDATEILVDPYHAINGH